jgi:hypothetical protein
MLFSKRSQLTSTEVIPSTVPREGLEPSILAEHDFESCAYTNSATTAH